MLTISTRCSNEGSRPLNTPEVCLLRLQACGTMQVVQYSWTLFYPKARVGEGRGSQDHQKLVYADAMRHVTSHKVDKHTVPKHESKTLLHYLQSILANHSVIALHRSKKNQRKKHLISCILYLLLWLPFPELFDHYVVHLFSRVEG